MRRLPGPAGDRPGDGGDSGGSLRIVSGLAVNTNSIFGADPHGSQTANGCPVLRHAGTTSREAHVRSSRILFRQTVRSPERTQESRAFQLTKDLHGGRSLKQLVEIRTL